MLFKLSNLNSNLALTLGYLNPALNNSALRSWVENEVFSPAPHMRCSKDLLTQGQDETFSLSGCVKVVSGERVTRNIRFSLYLPSPMAFRFDIGSAFARLYPLRWISNFKGNLPGM